MALTRRRQRSWVVAAALVALMPLLSACTVPKLTEATITFKPTLLKHQLSRHRAYNAFFTCSYTSGTKQFDDPAAGEVPVGYGRLYDGGFCWEQLGEAHRVLMQFDLSALTNLESKLVVSADLQIDERILAMRDADGDAMRAGGTPTCLGGWYQPDADPRTGNPWGATGEYTYERRLDGSSYRITGLVSAWVIGTEPNTGLLLRGQDEDVNAENSAACVSGLSGFRLTVRFLTSSSIKG